MSGELVRRDEGAVNPDLPTGEVELVASELEQLADAETPPFQIDEDDPVGEELRLRYRYLDLRKERMRDQMILRHEVIRDDPRPALRRGLPRDRDADPDPLHARGRARLPRAEPACARLLVRAAAVAAALQAAADGGRLRALLPDRALLPRRGLPRRPPARVHAARHGAVVRGGGGRVRRGRPPAAARARARRGRAVAAARADHLRRGHAALRLRPARPPAGRGDRATSRTCSRSSEFKVFAGAVEGGGVVRALKAARRVAAEPVRRADREGAGARRQGARVGGGRGRAGWRSPIAKFLSRGRDCAGDRRTRAQRGRRRS